MSIKNMILVVLICLVLIIAGFFGYLIYKDKTALKTISLKSEEKTEKAYPEDLKGEIYLTLANKKNSRLGIYDFNLEKNKLEEIYFIKNRARCYLSGGKINKNNDQILVADNCRVENLASGQISMVDRKDQIKNITKNSKNFKKMPVWSTNETQIAFMAVDSASNDSEKPTVWQIFVSDLEGNEKLIATDAGFPFFSPDDKKILALKKDGIFLFNLEDGTNEKIYSFEAEISKNTHIDLSLKKDFLAISNATTNETTIFRINSWDNFQMEEIAKIANNNSYISWLRFSPDDVKYLAVEEVFENDKVELVVYDIETKKRYFLTDLSDYIHDISPINDWR